MALRVVFVVTVAASAVASIAGWSWASGSPPLPKKALFRAVTPRNIEEVRNRLNGSPNDRNQLRVGTVLVYKTSAGNVGKMEIVKRRSRHHISGYDLYVKFVTYRPDGSTLVKRKNFRIKGTWNYDLDAGIEIGVVDSRATDFWWEWEDSHQAYLVFENGAAFNLVS